MSMSNKRQFHTNDIFELKIHTLKAFRACNTSIITTILVTYQLFTDLP